MNDLFGWLTVETSFQTKYFFFLENRKQQFCERYCFCFSQGCFSAKGNYAVQTKKIQKILAFSMEQILKGFNNIIKN